MKPFILIEELPAVSGKLGLITLQRCQALNAVDLAMTLQIQEQLIKWKDQEEIFAVVIQSSCERAFSAGGDIRALYYAKENYLSQVNYFFHEYRLNYTIAHYPKPIIPLMNGIVMGGGAGISIHASHRVAGEGLLFAMPETGIGLFPDIGASYFLNQTPGFLGTYLALTGARLNLADAMYAGLADYCVSSNHFSEIIQRLLEIKIAQGESEKEIDNLLNSFSVKSDISFYQENQNFIDSIFCAEDIFTILNYLHHDDGEWSRSVVAHLQQKAPTSLMVTLDAQKKAKNQPLSFCLKQDFALVQTFLKKPNLYEGIRAVIIDKDMQAKWSPADLHSVTPEEIAEYFDTTDKQILSFEFYEK